ncbi:MAG: Spy/CpxP family protein refolding chaperone [Methylocella sp.]
MKVQVSRHLSGLCVAAALAFAPLAASAQNAPTTGGGMKGGDGMGGGMMGGDMTHMMSMMREKLSHSGDRVAALKTDLKITESQMPAWNKFADALLASAKSMEASMDAMHKQMQSGAAPTLPEKLEHHAKMAAAHLANLQAIKAALDPLYASFSDEQKKLADGLKIGPMGVM